MRSLVFGCFPSALAGYKYCIIETVPVDKQLPTSVEVYKTLMFNTICIVSIGTGFRSSTVSSWLYTIYNICYILVPGTQMTSIFEGKPHKTRPFPIKTSVSWVPGTYCIHIYIYIQIFQCVKTPRCWRTQRVRPFEKLLRERRLPDKRVLFGMGSFVRWFWAFGWIKKCEKCNKIALW